MKLPGHLKALAGKAGLDPVLQFFFGSPDLLGVDIGSQSIKVVWLKQKGDKYRLLQWAVLPLELEADTPAEERIAQSVKVLKTFLGVKKVTLKSAATSVSGNSVIVRYVKFAPLSREELAQILPTEAEPFIPFDINEVALSFYILGEVEEEGQPKMETVLVAVKNDLLDDRLDILQKAGLRPGVVDVDAFTLENIPRPPSPQEGGAATLHLNIGNQVTNLSITEGKLTRVVRDVFIGGINFTKAIAKALQCDAAKAEDLKRSCGIMVSSQDKAKALEEGNREALAVSQALTEVARDLVSEVQRSVDFYLSQGSDRSIQNIILSGGSASLKNIAQYLDSDLKVPVEVLNPLAFVEGQGQQVPEEYRPSLAVATGLALRKKKDWLT
ncbi:MAG: type IV pilus assembly protein PilM [Elusimicrobia bacterium]|nr:type IV pilus assembly protein PilM [Elusimicrobiota bacterium]